MAAYRRVYDSRHLQADCQEPAPELYTQVWAAFTFLHLQKLLLMFFISETVDEMNCLTLW